MSKIVFGEMEEFNSYLKELDEDGVKYFLYLTKHGFEFNVIKDYVSRLKKIKENFGEEFIKNRGYESIPGSRNFIALNGRYILNKNMVNLIMKDIRQIYSLNKRLAMYNEVDVETVVTSMEKFMMFMLNKRYEKIEEDLVLTYVKELNKDEKLEFLKSIKVYNKIKKLELDEAKFDTIYIKIEQEINAFKNYKKHYEEMQKIEQEYPDMPKQIEKYKQLSLECK